MIPEAWKKIMIQQKSANDVSGPIHVRRYCAVAGEASLMPRILCREGARVNAIREFIMYGNQPQARPIASGGAGNCRLSAAAPPSAMCVRRVTRDVAAIYLLLSGGTMPFIRRYSTIWP